MIPSDPSQIIANATQNSSLNPSNNALLGAEVKAAQEAIESGLYVTWVPNSFQSIPASATDDIRNHTGQCCRIGAQSICQCGHFLSSHKTVVIPKRGGYIKPPTCTKCTKCRGYNYLPAFPEECAQIWLRKRKDFKLEDWRKVAFLSCFSISCNAVEFLESES